MATSGARDGFRPLHEAHAIEQLIVSIQFDRPLADAGMRAANAVMSRFQEALPGRSDIMGVGFQVGPQGVMPITQMVSDAPNGVVRTLSDRRGVVVKELRIDRQALVFRTLMYTRWDAVWGEAREYFSQLLPALGDCGLAAYGLTYHDKFVWDGPRESCTPNSLLREGSPYISHAVFGSRDLWHSHTGQFVATGGPARRLQVINIDCVDEADGSKSPPEPTRVVRIATALTDFLNQAEHAQVSIPVSESMGHLDGAFAELHGMLKTVFLQIVSNDAAQQVGLDPNAG